MMKISFLVLAMLSGCSAITVNEGPEAPKQRAPIVVVPAFDCNIATVCTETGNARIARSQIVMYLEELKENKNTCVLFLSNAKYPLRLNMTCTELDNLLNE